MSEVIEALATLEHLVNLSVSGQKITFNLWLEAIRRARNVLQREGYDLDVLDRKRPEDLMETEAAP